MCRWLAYSGAPVLLEELLYKPENSLVEQSLHSRLGAETTNGDGFGVGWYGDGRHAGGVQQHRAGVERPQPARARRAPPVPARARPHPRLDRLAGAADELPPVPPRPLAVDAQRLDRRVPDGAPGPRPARRPGALPGHRGLDRLRDCSSSSRSPSGLEDDPPASGGPRGRLRRGRPAASTASSIPIQMTVATTDGERIWALPLLERGPIAVAVPQRPTCRRCAPSTPTTRCSPGSRTRPASSSPSRSGTSGGPGTRCPSPRT